MGKEDAEAWSGSSRIGRSKEARWRVGGRARSGGGSVRERCGEGGKRSRGQGAGARRRVARGVAPAGQQEGARRGGSCGARSGERRSGASRRWLDGRAAWASEQNEERTAAGAAACEQGRFESRTRVARSGLLRVGNSEALVSAVPLPWEQVAPTTSSSSSEVRSRT